LQFDDALAISVSLATKNKDRVNLSIVDDGPDKLDSNLGSAAAKAASYEMQNANRTAHLNCFLIQLRTFLYAAS